MPKKREIEAYNNSVNIPVYNSASYYFDDREQVIEGLHKKSIPVGRYGRYNNPTWVHVENRLSQLSRAEDTLIFSSGMAAHFTTFIALLKAGDHVIFPAECYRQVRNIFHKILPKYGVIAHEVSIVDPEEFVNQVESLSKKHNVRLIHLEMPSSPHMYLIDLCKVKDALKKETIITMDSSFAPPPNFYALDWGVDLAIFSGTKYLNGHGDIIVGVVSGKKELIEEINWYRDTTGPVPDGQVAYLLNRSLHTLNLRIKEINEKGLKVANFLQSRPEIKSVLYTGLETHPHYALAKKYLNGHGGVITFALDLNEEQTSNFVDSLKEPFMASNFGAPQTLIEQSTFFTYYEYSEKELDDIGVSYGTVRLALGYIDDTDAIIADISKALSSLAGEVNDVKNPTTV
ncbi:PLP-dependent transferase [Pantoea sp. JV6]|uniref:PLP-dependent transferase n=1 Tax=Pantoea sp. JV6 TaxID=2981604 RepID=UPI00221ED7C8|nr:PLP-dependent transferase [Pantoea sp. JV6]MCW0977068.1 PLP-dependent transferase [Pantoea sp. JV6]